MKKRHWFDLLLFYVMSLFVSNQANATTYCSPSGTITRTDRYINSIAVSGGTEEFTLSGINKSSNRSVYQDLSADNILTVAAGSTLQFTVNWYGEWMHGYIYVDYDKDGAFSYDINSDGTPADNSEIVSYTYYSDKNSLGETATSSSKLNNIPAFEIPRNLATGDYRIRFKIDWNYLDPCGRNSGIDNSNADNAGDIIDFTLHVVEPEPLPESFLVTLPTVVNNGSLSVTYTDSEGVAQTLTNGANTIPTNSVLTIAAIPNEGYQLSMLTVNGANFTNGSTCVVDEEISIYVFFAEIGSYFSGNPFETMIRLGRMTAQSPIYQMPAGSANGGYITSATTSGDAIVYPLGYVATSAPAYFCIVSKETSLLSAGSTFELNASLSADISGKTVSVYTDWNRDGAFEKISESAQVNGRNFTQAIAIPDDASLGKNRVRVRIDSSTPTSADVSVSGRVYDFVFYITEASSGERTDCFISVTSSNNELGTAIIETAANANGRYDIGSEVTVKAVINPEAGSEVEFIGWRENGVIVSEEFTYTFVVSTSTSLVAVFEAPEPELTAPIVSTATAPVWYQIMNAHTADARKERYLAYDTNLDDTYTKELRAEKPVNTNDKFLWRLEDAGDGKVYLVNKGSNMQVYSSGVASSTDYLSVSSSGSKFSLFVNGVTENNYTIRYDGDDSKRLNAQDGTWGIVLYDQGTGTGSGWHFFRVNTPSGIEATEAVLPKAYLRDGHLTVTGLNGRNTLRVASLSGQILGTYVATHSTFEGNLKYAERFIILVIEAENGEQTILKLVDTKN